jgi:hypothetical protein
LPPKKNLWFEGLTILSEVEGKLSFSLPQAGGRGGVGGIPPAEPSQFRSDIFKQTPPNRILLFE